MDVSGQPVGPIFRGQEKDGIDRLSQNVFKKLKMGLIDCPEMSIRKYHYSLCNNPGEPSSQIWYPLIENSGLL